ncbi:phasin family protein [Cupriavidus sp. CV2]|uniref:phasin family protein n=1 Tax=Cupriavidus ulmosensis TaxID=3065913 RepID=UPI00296AC35A|nr:phasin family protein [Cupriavidus sp. CV2]MDW3687965.1 phasin family protein [Cupriavidus sp. CV2]
MSPLPPEQIAAAQKANLAILFGLTNKAFEGFEKLLDLNLQVMKSTLAETQEHAQQALSVKDQQELVALQASLMQPVGEKVLSYSRHLYDIASATQAEFAKVAEAQYEAHNRRMQELVDNLANSAPAGSVPAVAALTSVISATNKLSESMYQTVKQAVDVAERNFNAASTTASKAAKQAVDDASRAAKK